MVLVAVYAFPLFKTFLFKFKGLPVVGWAQLFVGDVQTLAV
jgi:hypothetical protein